MEKLYDVFQQRYPRKTGETFRDEKGRETPVFESRLIFIKQIVVEAAKCPIKAAREQLLCFRMPWVAKTLGAYPVVQEVQPKGKA